MRLVLLLSCGRHMPHLDPERGHSWSGSQAWNKRDSGGVLMTPAVCKICLPGNWVGSKPCLLQPVITHFNKYAPVSPVAIRQKHWIRPTNYPYFRRICSSHVTISMLVQFHGVNIIIYTGPTKGKRKLFTHSSVLDRLVRGFVEQQEVVPSDLRWNDPPYLRNLCN